MNTLRGIWMALAACGLAWSAGQASAQNLDLNGYWQSDAEGTVRIAHDVNTGFVLIEGTPCANGAQRPHTLAGALVGNTLTGSMWRCTNQELIDRCGHPPIYLVNFTATASLDPFTDLWRSGEIEMSSMRINANWLMEFYIVQDCKEKRKEDRADLFFVSRSNPQSTPRTSPGTAPPPLSQTCTGTTDVCEYWSCLWHRYGMGSPPQPCK
jgi:hypothetical protein